MSAATLCTSVGRLHCSFQERRSANVLNVYSWLHFDKESDRSSRSSYALA